MILVDTSVWIDFFNRPESKTAQAFASLIENNEALCINGLIEMELLQGIKSDRQMQLTQRMLKPYQYFPDIPKQWLELATVIYRKCRKGGRTIRKSAVCLIAAHALENDLTVFHQDRDFREIKKSFRNLKLLEF